MEKKELPKWAKTVTPFSKYLAMVLFILFPFIGFYLGLLVGENHPITVLPPAQLAVSPTVPPTLVSGQKAIYTFYICSPSSFVHCSDTSDANGQPILKPKQIRGINVISLDASLNGRTAELPVGTKVFLHFPTGEPTISVAPSKGVLEVPTNAISVGLGDIGVYKVVGSGTATITVTERKPSGKRPVKFAANYAQTWSGYYHKTQTSGPYTDITSYWTVPTITCNSGLGGEASAAWTGINDSSQNLIQTGTAQICATGGTPLYEAWWEILPADPTYTCTSINAGDKMFAEIKQNSGSNWTITLKDLTQNLDCSPASSVTYSGPQGSAEWILEYPPAYSSLANYGSTSFFNNTLNGVNPQHNYLTDSMEMTSTGDSSGTPLSIPSYPNNLTDAFSVYYCPSTGCPTANPPAEGWSIQSSPNSASTNNYLQAVTSTSTSGAWAVGYSQNTGTGTMAPIATHWNGSSWGSNAISGNSGDILLGVSAISSSNVLAVGYVSGSSTLAFHYDTSWATVPSDNPGSLPAFQAVGSDSSGDAWAVGGTSSGSSSHIVIEKYIDSSTGFQNWMLTGSDSAHTTVIGNLSGTTGNGLLAVAVNSSTDAWAVGSYYDSSNIEQPLTYHWDGTSWTNVTAPLPSGSSGATLRGVTEVSASNVWAVGTTSDYKTYIIHYDGSSWSIVSSPSPSYVPSLSAVSAVSANEVYAVGRYASSPSSPIQIPLVLKYDGTQWQQETAPSEGSGLSSYSGSILQGVTAPAPGEAFAVGYFAGNGSNYTFIDRLSVKYSPTTQATLSPNQNSDGYPDPVTVTLTALASPSATIANTYFTIDGGSQQTYSSPFTVTGAGSHTITYWSVDSNSNQEATNSKTFTIAPWYDNSYLYKKQLTIDHTKVSGGANLSNFPVLVSLTDADLKTAGNGGKVQSVHGFDIIFTDGTEITKLDHEIEKYDPATGTIAMWVRVPTLSASTDTTIYMYYDNSSITSSQENKTGVWDTNYKAVWHLGETFGTTNSDSTSNGATATKQSAGHPAALSSGQIAGAQNYNGTSDYQSVSSSAVNITGDKTVEMWLNTATFAAASDSTYRKPLIVNIDNTNVYMWLIVPGSPNCIQWMTDDSTGEHVSCWGNGGSGPSTNTWYHLTGTYTSATHSVKLYVNGALNTDGYTQNGVNKGTTGAKIGARVDNKSYFQGDIDELRISNTARTAGWITTDYNNQASPASFYSVGSQQ